MTNRIPRRPRKAAALVLAASILLAGCSGTGDPDIASARSQGSSDTRATAESEADQVKAYLAQRQDYVDCLRSHGMPNVGDPDQYGGFTVPSNGDTDSPTQRDATGIDPRIACQKVMKPRLPEPESLVAAQAKAAAEALTPAEIQMEEKWVTCMHNNGAPDMPDFNPQDPDNALPADSAADKQWSDYGQATPGAQRAFTTCQPIRDSYFGTP